MSTPEAPYYLVYIDPELTEIRLIVEEFKSKQDAANKLAELCSGRSRSFVNQCRIFQGRAVPFVDNAIKWECQVSLDDAVGTVEIARIDDK